MISQVKIPDGVYEQYKGYDSIEPERAMAQTLLRFAGVKPSDRILIIPSKDRQELEKLFDETLDTAPGLVNRIKDLLTLEVEGTKITLTPDVANLLAQQAEFEGMPQAEFLEQKVKEGVQIAVTGYAG